MYKKMLILLTLTISFLLGSCQRQSSGPVSSSPGSSMKGETPVVSSSPSGVSGSRLISAPYNVEKSSGSLPGAYSLYRYGLRRTNRTEFTGPKNPKVLRKIKLKGKIEAPAGFLPDGAIVIGTLGGYLYIINSDGTIRKEIKLESWVFSAPAVDTEGNIYLGIDNGTVYKFSKDGEMLWSYKLPAETSSSPALFAGRIFLGAEDYFLHAFDLEGNPVWKLETGKRIVFSAPAIDDKTDIYIGSDDGCLYQVHFDGTPGWKYKTKGGLADFTPTVGEDGNILIVSTDNNLYCVEPSGGTNWKFAYNPVGVKNAYAGIALGKDNTVFLAIAAGEFMAVDSDGKKKWETVIKWNREAGDDLNSSPLVDGSGDIYIASPTDIISYNPAGDIRWQLKNIGGPFSADSVLSPAGKLLIGGRDEYLYVVGDE